MQNAKEKPNIKNICFNAKLHNIMVREDLNYRQALDKMMSECGYTDVRVFLDGSGIIPDNASYLYVKYMNNEDMGYRPVFYN